VIIILAGQQDEVARLLAARWKTCDARLLTPEDLSIAGWRYEPHTDREQTAIINGRSVSSTEIAGVLTRLAAVSEHEVTHIVQHDRAYVAAEMTAFLSSWLTDLDCCVLNRPTPTCLSGPGWRKEQWVHFAASLSIPVCPVHRKTRQVTEAAEVNSLDPGYTVIVVGGLSFGAPNKTLADYAQRLAWASGVNLLSVHFSLIEETFRLASVDLWPDVTVPEMADAILEYFGRRPSC
jgi:hypothetical protein